MAIYFNSIKRILSRSLLFQKNYNRTKRRKWALFFIIVFISFFSILLHNQIDVRSRPSLNDEIKEGYRHDIKIYSAYVDSRLNDIIIKEGYRHDIKIYSAYVDSRLNDKRILRILALADKEVDFSITYFAMINIADTVRCLVTPLEIIETETDFQDSEYIPILMSAPVSFNISELVEQSVTISKACLKFEKSHLKNITEGVPIVHTPKKSHRRKEIGICLINKYDNDERKFLWKQVQVLTVFGIRKFILYTTNYDFSHPNVESIRIPLPKDLNLNEDVRTHIEANDCLYRFIHKVSHIIFLNYNEVLMPIDTGDLKLTAKKFDDKIDYFKIRKALFIVTKDCDCSENAVKCNEILTCTTRTGSMMNHEKSGVLLSLHNTLVTSLTQPKLPIIRRQPFKEGKTMIQIFRYALPKTISKVSGLISDETVRKIMPANSRDFLFHDD